MRCDKLRGGENDHHSYSFGNTRIDWGRQRKSRINKYTMTVCNGVGSLTCSAGWDGYLRWPYACVSDCV